MDLATIQTVASVLAAASAWIILAVVKNALPKYLEAKGKNLATKEDIGEITRLQEEAKVDFAEQLENLRGDLADRNEQLRNALASDRFWEEEYQRLVAAKVDALLTAYAEVLRWTDLIERERWAREADLQLADREFIEATIRIVTNTQILRRLSAIAPEMERSVLVACHSHRGSWDDLVLLIEEARKHYWGPDPLTELFQTYKEQLTAKANELRKSARVLDRAVVDLGHILVSRRPERGLTGAVDRSAG